MVLPSLKEKMIFLFTFLSSTDCDVRRRNCCIFPYCFSLPIMLAWPSELSVSMFHGQRMALTSIFLCVKYMEVKRGRLYGTADAFSYKCLAYICVSAESEKVCRVCGKWQSMKTNYVM